MCPLCRNSISNARTLAVQKLAEKLPHPCKYSDYGCTAKPILHDKPDHEKTCDFRPCACVFTAEDCNWTGPPKDMLAHIREAHKSSSRFLYIARKKIEFAAEDHDMQRFTVVGQSCYGEDFMLFIRRLQFNGVDFISALVVFLGAPEEAKEFTYQLEVRGPNRNLAGTCRPRSVLEDIEAVMERADDMWLSACDAKLNVRVVVKRRPTNDGWGTYFRMLANWSYISTLFRGEGPQTSNQTDTNSVTMRASSRPRSSTGLTSTLVSVFKCPVCLNPVTPPIVQCVSGHLMCLPCRNKVAECPLCKESVSNIRVLPMEKMAEKIYPYPCKYSDYGCTAKPNLCDKSNHEKTCDFRPCTCIFTATACKWTGTRQKLCWRTCVKHTRACRYILRPSSALEGFEAAMVRGDGLAFNLQCLDRDTDLIVKVTVKRRSCTDEKQGDGKEGQ
ncbi:hypothetical protein MTO96_016501 [Rhipicephalus appendiculatus]